MPLVPPWAKPAAILGLDMQNLTILILQRMEAPINPTNYTVSPEFLWRERDAKIREVGALK